MEVASRVCSSSIFVGAITAFMLAGCGNDPGLADVSGTVTMDGQPLPNAIVTFQPVQGAGSTSYGQTDENGQYILRFNRNMDGAAPGDYIVKISTYREGDEDAPDGGDVSPETIPARYNVNTKLKETVNPGSNTIDFSLESEGEIAEPSNDVGNEQEGFASN